MNCLIIIFTQLFFDKWRSAQRHAYCFFIIRHERANVNKPIRGDLRGAKFGFISRERDVIMNIAEVDTLEKDLFCPEDHFQNMLINERKRTERFGRPFMLILLDVGRLLGEGSKEKPAVLQNLAFALNSSTREIDMKGWYLFGSLVGIICPEFYEANKTRLVEKLRQKLKSFLEPEEAASIKIYCIMYPDNEVAHTEDSAPAKSEQINQEWPGLLLS